MGAWRCVIVPTTHSKSDWRGENRGASAPNREKSYRGLDMAMNSMPQHAVTNGYMKSEYFCAQCRSASAFVVTKPSEPAGSMTRDVVWVSSPIRELLSSSSTVGR